PLWNDGCAHAPRGALSPRFGNESETREKQNFPPVPGVQRSGHHRRMFTWRRVVPEYHHRPIMSAVLAAFGFGWLLLHIAGLLFGLASGKDVPVVWTLIGLMFLTLWTTTAFRVGRNDIFISDRGVQRRTVGTTKLFDWPNIRTFDPRPVPVVPGMQWLKSTNAAGYIWASHTRGNRTGPRSPIPC